MQESTFFVCTHVHGPRLTAVCYSEVTGPSSASEGASHVEMLPYTMKSRVSVALAAGVEMAEQTRKSEYGQQGTEKGNDVKEMREHTV